MQIVIVATCETSRGRIDVGVYAEDDGRMTGTKDSEPMEFSDYEALNLIAEGKARLPPPAPPVVEAPVVEPEEPEIPAADAAVETTSEER